MNLMEINMDFIFKYNIQILLALLISAIIIKFAPNGVITWLIGPILGLITIFISALDSSTQDFYSLIQKIYEHKLSDLYLLVCLTFFLSLSDGFELAWLTKAPRDNGQTIIADRSFTFWIFLWALNLLFAAIFMALATKIGDNNSYKTTYGFTPHFYIWVYMAIAIGFGIIFRFKLEMERQLNN